MRESREPMTVPDAIAILELNRDCALEKLDALREWSRENLPAVSFPAIEARVAEIQGEVRAEFAEIVENMLADAICRLRLN